MDYVEVLIKEIVIHSLFVMPFVIDKPNAVEAVHSAVIAHSKNAAVLSAERAHIPFVSDTHN